MRTITDLSGTLENGLWGYHELPGLEKVLPRFHLETATTLENDSFLSSRFSATTVSGLYLESQAHIIEGGTTLDQYGVERFIVPAKIVKLPGRHPRRSSMRSSWRGMRRKYRREMLSSWQPAGEGCGTSQGMF